MKFKIAAVFSLLLCLPGVASANLIVNGSFEDNDVRGNTWRWFTADRVNGWQGSNIEIWDDFLGVQAVEGTQFAELNAHGQKGQPFTIFQTFNTQVGVTYDLSFYYRARRSSNEAFEVSVDDNNAQNLFSRVVDDHVKGQWSFFTAQFVAVSQQTSLFFASIFPHSGTVGNFIDDVRVVGAPSFRTQSVTEPSSILLVLLSAGGIVWLRRNRNQQKRS